MPVPPASLPDPFAPVQPTLRDLRRAGRTCRVVRLWSPWPIVAFSRRDERSARFADGVEAATAAGFHAVVRPVGGTFAPMHAGSLIVDEYGYTPGEEWPTARFDRHVGVLARAFAVAGVDARIGELPGEYCPGAHSVNAGVPSGGRVKVSGTAQRVSGGAWLVSSVVQVRDAAPLRMVTASVARALSADVRAETVGVLEDVTPGIEVRDVASLITAGFVENGADRVEWAE